MRVVFQDKAVHLKEGVVGKLPVGVHDFFTLWTSTLKLDSVLIYYIHDISNIMYGIHDPVTSYTGSTFRGSLS